MLIRVVIVHVLRRSPELVNCHLVSKTRWRCSVVLMVVMHAYQETVYDALFPSGNSVCNVSICYIHVVMYAYVITLGQIV